MSTGGPQMTDEVACVACADAHKNRIPGGVYQSGCRGCMVRKIAMEPKAWREAAYSAVLDPEARAALKSEVMAEYRRIKGE